MRCAVSSCKNSVVKTKKENPDVMYHSFPRDPTVRNIWIERAQKEGKLNPRTRRICSVHFTKNDYVRSFQKQLMGYNQKKKLKPDAIPSVSLDQKCSTNSQELLETNSTSNTNESILLSKSERSSKNNESINEMQQRIPRTE